MSLTDPPFLASLALGLQIPLVPNSILYFLNNAAFQSSCAKNTLLPVLYEDHYCQHPYNLELPTSTWVYGNIYIIVDLVYVSLVTHKVEQI